MNKNEWWSSKEGWWSELEKNWDDILFIMVERIPLHDRVKIDKETDEITISNHRMIDEVNMLKRNRNPHLCRYLFATWESLPDQECIHGYRGFGVLCDLLSEEGILYDEI
jgi:hypothetical protein